MDIFSTLGSIISSAATSFLGSENANSNAKDERNYQNQYNSPSAQMQRYKDAGLNPNLIYGSGSASSGNQASPTQLTIPDLDINSKLMQTYALQGARQDLINKGKEGLLKDAQISGIEETILKTRADAANKNLLSVYQNLRNQLENERSKNYRYKAGLEKHSSRAQYQKILEEIGGKQLTNINLQTDQSIKQQILKEKQYYNQLLQQGGIQKNDNVFIRGGMSVFNKLRNDPYFNKSLSQPQKQPTKRATN